MQNSVVLCLMFMLMLSASCRQHVIEQTIGADTLAAVATNAHAVIGSIVEKSFNGEDGYYLRRSPEYYNDSMSFFVECFFNPAIRLPELIINTNHVKGSKDIKTICLNQNNALYFVSQVVTDSVMSEEKRGFYQKNKLRFADIRIHKSNVSPESFRLMNKDETELSNLPIEKVTPIIETWLNALEMKLNYDLYCDSIVEENGSLILVAHTSDAAYRTQFIVRPPVDRLPGRGKKINVVYHIEGKNAIADSIGNH